MSRVTSFSEWLLRQPLIWGGLGCLAFYAAFVHNAPADSFQARYFAGHTVAYCTTALFCVGLAALLIRLLGLVAQFASLDRVRLPNAPDAGNTEADASQLQAALDETPASLADSYLVRRLRDALQYVERTASADTLESHLRHLEDADVERMHHGYAMVRIIVSIIPILGFLGTVIGITLAIAKLNLSGEAMEDSLPAVVSGLSVAFDTTALALTLSTLLLFAKFCVERVDLRLIAAVDANASRQLLGRFRRYGSGNDPHLASVRRMSEQLLEAVQATGQRQTELFVAALEHSSEQTGKMLSKASGMFERTLASATSLLDETLNEAVAGGLELHAKALNEGVERHAGNMEDTLIRHAELLNEGLQQHTESLADTETKLAEENRRHLADVEAAVGEAMLLATNRQEKLITQSEQLLKEMQIALVEAAGTTVAQQEQLIKQGGILLKVVEATGQVKRLEEVLNSNLAALSNSHNFEQTVAGLSAALQLLGARLGQPLATDSVALSDQPPTSKAA